MGVVVWVVRLLDVFLVRKDLLCDGHGISSVDELADKFGSNTGVRLHSRAPDDFKDKWTLDFRSWLRAWKSEPALSSSVRNHSLRSRRIPVGRRMRSLSGDK